MASTRRRWVETGNEDADAFGDGRRNEILEATWRLIATIGLEKTTMRRIADEVDCTTGLVTHYFASKDDVLLGTLQKVMQRSTARLREARKTTDGGQRLRSLVFAVLPLDEPRLMEWRVWVAFWGRAYSSPRLRKEQQAWYRRWRQTLQRELEELESVGVLPGSVGSEVETARLVALIVGLSVESVVTSSSLSRTAMQEVVDRHLSHLTGTDMGPVAAPERPARHANDDGGAGAAQRHSTSSRSRAGARSR